jgi:hypothetical protein
MYSFTHVTWLPHQFYLPISHPEADQPRREAEQPHTSLCMEAPRALAIDVMSTGHIGRVEAQNSWECMAGWSEMEDLFIWYQKVRSWCLISNGRRYKWQPSKTGHARSTQHYHCKIVTLTNTFHDFSKNSLAFALLCV